MQHDEVAELCVHAAGNGVGMQLQFQCQVSCQSGPGVATNSSVRPCSLLAYDAVCQASSGWCQVSCQSGPCVVTDSLVRSCWLR